MPTKPKTPTVDDLESAAYSDLASAIKSGDEEAGRAALRDFVQACIQRNEEGEYDE
jgi:hypothetical protein